VFSEFVQKGEHTEGLESLTHTHTYIHTYIHHTHQTLTGGVSELVQEGEHTDRLVGVRVGIEVEVSYTPYTCTLYTYTHTHIHIHTIPGGSCPGPSRQPGCR
jgi:hypothetical protein